MLFRLIQEDDPLARRIERVAQQRDLEESPRPRRKFAKAFQAEKPAVGGASGSVEAEAIALDSTPPQAPSGSCREHVKCVIEKYERLNKQLGEHREKAWNEGLHLWVLAENDRIVGPSGFMPVGVEGL